jgi:hypothetical protein
MRALILVLALFTSGCLTPCPAPAAGPTTARFVCEDGGVLDVTFSQRPDRALVVQEGYSPLILSGRLSGSGFRYAGDGAELRVRMPETLWVRPGAAETTCRAQN